MIRRHFDELNTDSTGKELFDYESENGAALGLTANEYYVTHIIPHWHAAFEAFVLLEGSIKVLVNGTEYALDAGDGCLINSGALHEFVSSDGEKHAYHSIVFDPGIVSGMVGSVFDSSYVRPLIEQGPDYIPFTARHGSSEFADAFASAFGACENEPPAYEFAVRNALSAIIVLALNAASMRPARPFSRAQDALAKKMIAFIDAHLTERVSLSEIAGSAAVSPRECQRIFEKYLRRSPVNYLNMRRIYAAAAALLKDDTPITEIAMAFCFESPSYFTSRFRSVFSMTPREYRNLYAADRNTSSGL